MVEGTLPPSGEQLAPEDKTTQTVAPPGDTQSEPISDEAPPIVQTDEQEVPPGEKEEELDVDQASVGGRIIQEETVQHKEVDKEEVIVVPKEEEKMPSFDEWKQKMLDEQVQQEKEKLLEGTYYCP